MRDRDYDDAIEFLARFFEFTQHAVEIRALPLVSGSGPVRTLFTRTPDEVVVHCQRWDGQGRAVYFGTATRRGGSGRGDRVNLMELVAVWVDIDCYKLGVSKDEAVRALLVLPIPPSVIIDSGGGIHGYWLLLESIDISQDAPDWPSTEHRVVSVLRQLAGVLAGDIAVCDLARIMRLPGTHNSKDGTLRPCVVLSCSTWTRVSFGDLEDMLAVQRPLLTAPAGMAAAVVDDDPFLAAARALVFTPAVDIEARLSAMVHLGVGETAIHATQLSVTASMASTGVDDDTIAGVVLAATERAAGQLAPTWNWRREEAAIRSMIASAKAKFAPENRPSARSSATIIELRGGGAKPRADDAPTEAPPLAAAKNLPEIRLGGGYLPTNIDDAEHHLAAAKLPIFIYGDQLSRVAPGPITIAVGHAAREIHGDRVLEVRATALRDDLSRVIDFRKYDGRSKKWVSVNCPPDIAEGLLARTGQWRKLPVLRGIIAAPVIRPDNSLLDRPGYDYDTGLYFAPAGTVFPVMPSRPTRDDALAAIAVLKYPLRDIPFIDSASWSVALSAILTGLDRAMMEFAPIHAFDSPQAGSGKGLVCNYGAVIATGHEAGAVLASTDPAETDKTLGAKIIAGHSIILLDNVDHVLKSALLAQIASEPYVEPRILGRSNVVKVQNTFAILVNGNNLVLAGDLARRSLKARLDAHVTRPELRVFTSDNPVTAAKRDRGRLVAAGLTILLAYRLAGMPDQGIVPLGTFDTWSSHVRSALIWAGEADPVVTQETIRAADKDMESHANLLAAWFEAVQAGVTVSRLAEIACQFVPSSEDAFATPTRKNPELFDAIYEIAPSRPDKIDTAKLGYYLRSHVDHTVADMRIERAGAERTRAVLWRVAKLTENS